MRPSSLIAIFGYLYIVLCLLIYCVCCGVLGGLLPDNARHASQCTTFDLALNGAK